MAEYLQVLTTVGSREEAGRIAAALVERRLAACVQMFGPIVSRYRWEGAIEEAEEWQCLAKTEAGLFEEVEAAIRELHSYEEPEIVAMPIVAGSAGYLGWVSAEVRARD
ncbi:MAG TPA: divalent-cation tolerance protein CutA [Solirubrobacterales bacterium]|nr:divalent-cation tolerance protein CutA [Solirubrobacterales bacterium]